MIERAGDPSAKPMDWRGAGPRDSERTSLDPRAGRRSAHPWPFISRFAEKPAAQEPRNHQDGNSGS